MGNFIDTLMTFILSGVVLQLFVIQWQHRNWLNQQKLIKANIELAELKKIAEQITQFSDARNYRARRLCRSINNCTAEELILIRKDYSNAVTIWNDAWNTFTVKLTMYADFSRFVNDLNQIQAKFVEAGGLLLYCLKNSDSPYFSHPKNQLEDCLNSISGMTFVFSRNLLKLILEKENEAYSNPKENFSRENFQSASTWKLLKFLFKLPQAS